MAPRSLGLLLAAGVLLLAACAEASLHDGSRGFKTARTPQHKVDEYMKHRHPDSVLHRMKNKDKLLEHPDVQKFMEWRNMHQAGHPDAGAAFAGKLPHDFIPLLATLDEEDKRQADVLAAQQAQQQASDAIHVEL